MVDRDSALGAVRWFSDLAADFKLGIVPNEDVRAQLTVLFTALGLSEQEIKLELGDAMVSWGEWPEEEEV